MLVSFGQTEWQGFYADFGSCGFGKYSHESVSTNSHQLPICQSTNRIQSIPLLFQEKAPRMVGKIEKAWYQLFRAEEFGSNVAFTC